MKTKIILFAVVMLISLVSFSQSCLPDGIVFSNQSEIDNFQNDYPGCTEIEGNVKITGYMTNLLGLSSITSIQGSLTISIARELINLEGLNNLLYIGKDLTISISQELINLEGLNNLLFIGKDLTIVNCLKLNSISSLEGLTTINGDLSLYTLPKLQNLTGLEGLTTIKYGLRIDYLSLLQNLTGLEGLDTIGGGLGLFNNGSLQNLNGLRNLVSIGGGFPISQNNALTSLTGLNSLVSIGMDLSIYGNNHLTNLAGIDHLKFIGDDLNITYNNLLENLSGLDSLEIISDEILITGNNKLNSLSGLCDSVSIGGGLSIIDNNVLSDCAALGICNCLLNPNGPVKIYNNASGCANPPQVAASCGFPTPCLPYGNYYFKSQEQIDSFQNDYPDCTTLNGLVSVSSGNIQNLNGLNQVTTINGNLSLRAGNLTNLNGLASLTSISGDLKMVTNYKFINMSGLENLNSIGGNFIIDNDYECELINFSGLDTLTTIGGDFTIKSNSKLINFSGLERLRSIGGAFLATNNIKLTTLSGLEGLTHVKNININNNQELIDISSLGQISPDTLINLSITNNTLLNFCGIPSICEYLASPNGVVDVYNNSTECMDIPHIAASCGISLPCLPFGNYNFTDQAQIDNFSNDFPDCTEIFGNMSITGTITNLNGLHNITTIYGNLILSNLNVSDLNGLDNLISVGGDLKISDCNVENLVNLSNLTYVGKILSINYNHNLTSLEGLEGIDVFGHAPDEIDLYNNPNLSFCAIESICNYLNIPGGCYFYASFNATGCKSENEVRALCGPVGIVETNPGDGFVIFPNPADDKLQFINQNGSVIREVRIYNQIGQLVYSNVLSETIDISKLKPGLFIVELITDASMIRKKIIVN